MKILLLNHEFTPIGTGAANATYYLSRELVSLGAEIKIITAGFKATKRYEIINGVKVLRIPSGRRHLISPSAIELFSFLFSGILFTFRELKRDRPDLIHTFFTIPSGLIACLLKKTFKIPYIVSIRGSDVPGYDKKRFLGLLSFSGIIVKWIWRNSSGVFSNGEMLKSLALKTDRDIGIKIIPNGVDLLEFYPGRRAKDQSIKILLVGQLIMRKRFHLIIEILPELCKELKDKIVVKIVGDGPQRDYLEKLAEQLGERDKINFLGNVPHAKLSEVYRDADIFILPSEREGMANVILEALATGLPIIVTKSGTETLIKDGLNGFVEKGDVKDFLKKSILTLARDKNLLNAMGQKSIEIAQDFSWNRVACSYQKNYQDILSKN